MIREPTLSERVLLGMATAALILWCLVVLVVALGYLGPSSGLTWVVRTPRSHEALATMPHVAGLVFSVLGACLMALLCRILWQRQAENSQQPAA